VKRLPIIEKMLIVLVACLMVRQPVGAHLHMALIPSSSTSAYQSDELSEAQALSEKVARLCEDRKFEEALPLAKLVVEKRKKLLLLNDARVRAALSALADVYIALKKYDEALPIYVHLLTAEEKEAEVDKAKLAFLLDKVAILYYHQGYRAKSESLYNRALSIRESSFGADSGEVAESLCNLAEFYRFTHQRSKADADYERALAIREKLLKHDDPLYVETTERYFCLLTEMQDPGKIKAWYDRFLEKDKVLAGNRVQDGVLNLKAVSLPMQRYPLGSHASGVVIVRVLIDESGRVIETANMCGASPALFESASMAAYAARFAPRLMASKPVSVEGFLAYNFVAR
jgi:tetratricopeptide (TPR) repeat protein